MSKRSGIKYLIKTKKCFFIKSVLNQQKVPTAHSVLSTDTPYLALHAVWKSDSPWWCVACMHKSAVQTVARYIDRLAVLVGNLVVASRRLQRDTGLRPGLLDSSLRVYGLCKTTAYADWCLGRSCGTMACPEMKKNGN